MTVTPKQAAMDVLDRATDLLSLDIEPTPEPLRQDLRRLSLSMASAAIDTYFHWLVRKTALPTSGKVAKSLEMLDINFGDLVSIVSATLDARRKNKQNRPNVRVSNVLSDRILKDTYQTVRGIETAMGLCGISGYWGKISKNMGEPPEKIKARLKQLAHRRNKIVHEGDLARQARPRAIKHNPLTEAEIKHDLDWVRKFIDAVAQIT